MKVRYIGETCYEFDYGEIREAKYLDRFNVYAMKGRGGDDEYAFPVKLFEVVNESPDNRNEPEELGVLKNEESEKE